MGEYKRLHEGKLPGALRIDCGGTGYDRWQWSASSGRYGKDYVRIVDFTDGYDGWDYRNGNLLSGRACFCEIVETVGKSRPIQGWRGLRRQQLRLNPTLRRRL